jgi:hypothetical protein
MALRAPGVAVAVPTAAAQPPSVEGMPGLEDDLHAAVGADRELGRDYETAVVRALAERLDHEIDRRVDERMRMRQSAHDFWSVLLALASIGLALGVPSATHDQLGNGGALVVTLVAWTAIVAINVAYAAGRRRR